ncbi:MAG: hypothetical protein HF978_00990, partial [Desulfobacteraceae bacterium]|nr:phage integrase N-terminal SAM-like domain-containing protein [Desulfobacteraceae bacterium]MBC2754105.1 hypothetical protein [Desulfobacteraceae bacterium]
RFYGNDKHPKDMGKNEVERFLSFLTEKRNVSAATQNQALNALIFLYKKLWGQCFHEQNHLLLELEQDGILIHVPQDEKKLVI